MKDIDIRTIQPVQGHRKPDQAGKADPVAGQKFGQALESAQARTGEAKSEPPDVSRLEQKLDQEGLQIKKTRDSLNRLLVDMQLLGKTGKPGTDPDGNG